jgi:hypothetical protein
MLQLAMALDEQLRQHPRLFAGGARGLSAY